MNYRKRAIEAHGAVCDECGSEEQVEIHHRDGDRTNNDIDNLLPLCTDCHQQVHGSGLNGLESELKPRSERQHIQERADIHLTVSLPTAVDEALVDVLEYGDSKSGFIREAIVEKLNGARDVSAEEPLDGRSRKGVKFRCPKELNNELESVLGYGSSKAAWIRDAVRNKVERELAQEAGR